MANKFTVIVLVDSNGDYAVGKDDADAQEKYEADIGELGASGGYRLVLVELDVPLPGLVELEAVVPVQGAPSIRVK